LVDGAVSSLQEVAAKVIGNVVNGFGFLVAKKFTVVAASWN
jgi:hypothetical protein